MFKVIISELRGLYWSKEFSKTYLKQLQGGFFCLRESPDKFLKYICEEWNPRYVKDDSSVVKYIDEAHKEVSRRKNRGDWTLN